MKSFIFILFVALCNCSSKAQPISAYTVEVVDTLKADGVIFPYVTGDDSRDTVEFRPIVGTVDWNIHKIHIDGNNYFILSTTQADEDGLLLFICTTTCKKQIILVYDEEGLSQIEIPSDRTIYSSNTVDLWAERVNHN